MEKILKLHNEKNYRPVVVAILSDSENRLLLVQSAKGSNPWSFPQGGIDKGESPENALFREIYEETGIVNNEITIIQSDVYYKEVDAPKDRKDKRGFKKGKAYFFIYCKYDGDGKLLIQKDEIIDYLWLNKNDIEKYFSKGRKEKKDMTYEALSKVIW